VVAQTGQSIANCRLAQIQYLCGLFNSLALQEMVQNDQQINVELVEAHEVYPRMQTKPELVTRKTVYDYNLDVLLWLRFAEHTTAAYLSVSETRIPVRNIVTLLSQGRICQQQYADSSSLTPIFVAIISGSIFAR